MSATPFQGHLITAVVLAASILALWVWFGDL